MDHKGTVKIETERLILRRFEPNDVSACFKNWMSDERVTKFLRWIPHESEQETARILNMWLDFYKNLPFYQWAIVPKEFGEPIGSISVVSVKERTETLHVGYCIGFDWWGMGYTSEALEAIIKFFFESVHAQRIESQHDPENRASGRVMEKCGMKYEGTLRKADFSNRGIVDACVYAILAEDYREKLFIDNLQNT